MDPSCKRVVYAFTGRPPFEPQQFDQVLWDGGSGRLKEGSIFHALHSISPNLCMQAAETGKRMNTPGVEITTRRRDGTVVVHIVGSGVREYHLPVRQAAQPVASGHVPAAAVAAPDASVHCYMCQNLAVARCPGVDSCTTGSQQCKKPMCLDHRKSYRVPAFPRAVDVVTCAECEKKYEPHNTVCYIFIGVLIFIIICLAATGNLHTKH